MYINNNYKSTEMHTNRVTLNHTSSSSNSNTNTFLNRIKRHEQDTCDSCRNICKDSTIRKKNDNLVLLSNGKLISKGFSSKRSLSSDERYKFLYSISSSSSSNDTESITSSQLQIKQMLDDYKEGHQVIRSLISSETELPSEMKTLRYIVSFLILVRIMKLIRRICLDISEEKPLVTIRQIHVSLMIFFKKEKLTQKLTS